MRLSSILMRVKKSGFPANPRWLHRLNVSTRARWRCPFTVPPIEGPAVRQSAPIQTGPDGTGEPASRLLECFDHNGLTDWPWHQDRDPYKVRVSEISIYHVVISEKVTGEIGIGFSPRKAFRPMSIPLRFSPTVRTWSRVRRRQPSTLRCLCRRRGRGHDGLCHGRA